MSAPREAHIATFYSPGTFFAESSERPVSEWDTREAARIAATITERYGAVPYGFQFRTLLVADPVPDGLGGTMNVQPKELRKSCMYFINGRVLSLAQVKVEMPSETILIGNMEYNRWTHIVTGPLNGKGWRWTQPFAEDAKLVDADGNEVEVPL